MATVYSAVLFGGRLGKSVAVDATTDYVTLTYHGLRDGKGIAFKSGTLPDVTGDALALDTVYYAKNISLNTFELYRDLALSTKIDFVTTGSSLIVYSAMWLAMSAGSRLRYGTAGSERVYDSLSAAHTNLVASTDSLADNVVEILMAFNDQASAISVKNVAQSLVITSIVDGQYSEAFHNGISGSGYTLTSYSAGGGLTVDSYFITIESLEFHKNSPYNGTGPIIALPTSRVTFRNNIVRNVGLSTYGITVTNGADVYQNIVMAGLDATYGIGIYVANGGTGAAVSSNLVTKCWKGFACSGNGAVLAFNNLAIGNTINWGNAPNYDTGKTFGNIGGVNDFTSFTWSSASSLNCTSTVFFATGQPVALSTTGSLPTVGGVPLDPNIIYWVSYLSGNTFNLKYKKTDFSAISFNGAGTGTHKIITVWASLVPPSIFIDFTDPALVFMDWANNDFRPAGYGTSTPGSQALMVDAAVVQPSFSLVSDIINSERPGYKNGSPEYSDVGPYEFDFGYGPRPASYTLTLTNVVIGSHIFIRDQGDTITHYDDIAVSTTVVVIATVYADSRDLWRIKVRKGTSDPFYQPYETLATAFAGSASLFISQLQD